MGGLGQIANVLLRIILYSAVKVRCSTLGLSCPTTLNLPYSEREIKIEGFGGRPPFGGRPGALGPPLNPALLRKAVIMYYKTIVMA